MSLIKYELKGWFSLHSEQLIKYWLQAGMAEGQKDLTTVFLQ